MGAETVIAVHLVQAKLEPKASPSSFAVLSWSLDAVTSSNERLSPEQANIAVTAAGGSTFGKNDEGLPVFSLGGPLRLSAYATNELLTNQYFLFRAGYIRRIKGQDSLFGNRYYLFGAYERTKWARGLTAY